MRCSSHLDRLAHAGDPMCSHIVHEDDVALLKRWHEHLLDVGEESGAIHRAVDHVGRGYAVDAQGRNERQRLPMSVRHLVVDQALSDRCATVEPCNLRRYRSLVDENETGGIELGLLSLQRLSRGRDVRPILLTRMEDFF